MRVRRRRPDPVCAVVAVAALTLASCSDAVGSAQTPVSVLSAESSADGSTESASGGADPAAEAEPGLESAGSSVPAGTTLPETTLAPMPVVRFDVADAPAGFAQTQGLTGGFGQPEFVVTSTADSGPGSYREALSGGQRHVRFDPSLAGQTIDLAEPVIVGGDDITLDGSGVDVVVSGRATRFSGTNIIVAGMTYRDHARTEDDDALTFLDASETQVIGLFANHFSHATDGLVDFIWNRKHDVYVTACGNRFERHDKAMLIHSGRDGREGGIYHVTLCHNVWSDIYQRTPLSRDAFVHQYNSVFERYGKPNGDGGGSKAGDGDDGTQHLLENNVAIPRVTGETTFDGSTVSSPRAEWAGPQLRGDGYVSIRGTLLETVDGVTAIEVEQDADQVARPPYDYQLVPASPAMRDAVLATAGTCVPVGEGHIVPCAPLLLLEPGATVVATVDGASASVRAEMGGEAYGTAVDDGGGRWTVALDDAVDSPAEMRIVVTTSDGREVASDPIIVAVVP